MQVWYLVCYTPLVPRLPGPALLLALLAQDLQRIGLVSAGVRAALALYPNTFLIPVLVATVKSSGFMLVKYYEHILLHGLDRGFSLPNHATKTMVNQKSEPAVNRTLQSLLAGGGWVGADGRGARLARRLPLRPLHLAGPPGLDCPAVHRRPAGLAGLGPLLVRPALKL